MSKIRSHVSVLVSPNGVARGTQEIEEKAKAEVSQPTPETAAAKKALDDNVVESVEVTTKKPKTR
jgi:hypothetical protein